ncbi:MAG: ATP-binding protein, partial [Acidobacteriota bacterium]|nr:ATP-binding protein [Acidobacteriota bacterium]
QLRFRRLQDRNRRLEEIISRRTAEVLERKEELGAANRQLAHANRQLRRINDELANLDRENADFLAIAAHDLRTPLVNLKGFAGEIHGALKVLGEVLAAGEKHLDARARRRLHMAFVEDMPEALGFIDSSTERMDQLIDALLALSQLGRQKLVLQPVDMRALVHETLRSLTYQISRNRVRVTVGDLPVVQADRGSMKQVMENLLNNAVNYLDPQRPGRVEISAEEQGSEVVIHVRDNGRGIAEDQAHQVFKIFGRAGAGDVPGEGVGLAFVRTLIERHGGRIWFESEENQGTVFSFSLPKRHRDQTHGA